MKYLLHRKFSVQWLPHIYVYTSTCVQYERKYTFLLQNVLVTRHNLA
jgi:hypothetical protein